MRVIFMSADQNSCVSSCQVPMPMWIRGDVLDVKRCVSVWESDNNQETTAGEVPILALLQLCYRGRSRCAS